jgi:hypothetical protein
MQNEASIIYDCIEYYGSWIIDLFIHADTCLLSVVLF